MGKNIFTTLVSCRIDNNALVSIDKFREGRSYLKRSGIINQALVRLFRDYDEQAIYNFLFHKEPLK